MSKLINVRGTNGSGKSTLLRKVIEDYGLVPYIQRRASGKEEILGYASPGAKDRIGVIGRYSNACGGCDTINTQQAIKDRIDRFVVNLECKTVLFEGIVVSTIFQPWLDFSRAHGGMIWAYLDTPLDECYRRIRERNGEKEIKENLVAVKFSSILSTRRKAEAAGEKVVILPHADPYPVLKGLING